MLGVAVGQGSGAAQRLGALFMALFGGGVRGTVLAAAVLCSAFTAITGGSGVTILALGGLLLPLLRHAGYAEQRGIGLVTSASALGVLVAPSVPLIMYAVIARVPITEMFLAGLVPAVVMVASLLFVGGYLRRDRADVQVQAVRAGPDSIRLTLAIENGSPGQLALSAAETPTASEIRAPYRIWLRMSWPMWFVPNRCPGEPGGLRPSCPP